MCRPTDTISECNPIGSRGFLARAPHTRPVDIILRWQRVSALHGKPTTWHWLKTVKKHTVGWRHRLLRFLPACVTMIPVKYLFGTSYPIPRRRGHRRRHRICPLARVVDHDRRREFVRARACVLRHLGAFNSDLIALSKCIQK